MTHTRDTFIARQPIFDRRDRVYGYEILFRNSFENFFPPTDSDEASARNLAGSMMGFGLEPLTGGRLAFVNVSRRVLLEEMYTLLPPARTVVELLETVAPDAEVLEACRSLRRHGYLLALDDYVFRPATRALFELADIVKVDFRQDVAVRADVVKQARGRRVRLLAEKVETRAERDEAERLGYQYFQGYFYCRPEVLHARMLAPAKLNYLRLLAEINQPDVSFERVETVIRSEVALSVRLLRYLNSAGFGWHYEVKTIEQATRLLGVSPLRKWASMMAVLGLADGKPPELVVTALVRARLAELLAGPLGLEGRELELFLVGLLSVMDAVMDQPLADLVASMAVSPEIADALLHGRAPLGPALGIVVAQEAAEWRGVDDAATSLGSSGEEVQRAWAEATEWAQDVVANA